MRTLAIDFGERRVGIATSGPDGTYAIALQTLERRTDRILVAQITALASEQGAERLVVGEPKNVDGSQHAASERIRRFAGKLRARSKLPVLLVEETLTTVAARERLEEAGVSVEERPEALDATAAQILLEDLLARESSKPRESSKQGAGSC